MANSAKSISILKLSGCRIEIDVPNILKILGFAGNRPLVIHSINGKSREGKSLMMNFFLQYLRNHGDLNPEEWFNPSELQLAEKGFMWRGGSKRTTEGIDAWSQPFFRTINGREVAIILLDTQGAFDDTTSFQQNAVIFAVSALLSSTMIWSQKRDISEDLLQFLLSFVGFTTLACDDPQSADKETRQSFQRLIFLLRDFPHSKTYPFGYHSDTTSQRNNYKVDKLNPNESRDSSLNFIRRQIHSSFEEVGIFALPYPGDDLVESDNAENLEKKFQLHTKEFAKLIFSVDSLKRTKHVGGIEVTGETFKEFVRRWAQHFESSDLPDLKDFLDTSIEIQHTLAIKNSIQFYDTNMHEIINENSEGLGNVLLQVQNDAIVAEAITMFMTLRKLGGPQAEEQYTCVLLDELEKRFEFFKNMDNVNFNSAKRREAYQQNIQTLNEEIKRNEQKARELEAAQELERQNSAKKIEEEKRIQQELHEQLGRNRLANVVDQIRARNRIHFNSRRRSSDGCPIF